ncbi:DUF3862 domain-containing protein [Viridibacillus arvi]|uniref:DUF3862 domain-containing protein n=1 Tax=Viridibacillus arvi TaxID=263475 RepID=UPI0012EDDB66|nr:DUF3862 domain-containing protein [Viridibacillus arvi]
MKKIIIGLLTASVLTFGVVTPTSINGQDVAYAKSKVTITKKEFNKIKNGMSYKSVKKIVGGKGELISEVGQKGDPYYTYMIMYYGKDGISNANFTFQGGKLQMKAQFLLK